MIRSAIDRRRFPLSLLAAAALCGACEPDPDALVFMLGTVADTHGTPLANRPVALRRSGDEDCLAPLSPWDVGPTFADWAATSTDADGRYGFPLRGTEVSVRFKPGSDFYGYCFEVDTPGTDPVASVRVEHDERDMELPPLLAWDAQVSAASSASGPLLTVASLPALPGVDSVDLDPQGQPLGAQRNEWVLQQGNLVIWVTPAEEGSTLISADVLEDFAEVTAIARLRGASYQGDLSDTAGVLLPGFTFVSTAHSPPLALGAGSRVPVSRGAPCFLDGVPRTPCPFTDGDPTLVPLETRDMASHPGPIPLPKTVELRLSAPRQLRAAVVRALLTAGTYDTAVHVLLEGSSDGGATWSLLGDLGQFGNNMDQSMYQQFLGNTTYLAGELAPGAPAVDRVRLRQANHTRGQDFDVVFSGLGELSLFE